MHRYMEQMHEIVLSRNRFRDGAMVGRAMRAVKTLKKLDLSENEMTDLRQVGDSTVLTFESSGDQSYSWLRYNKESLTGLVR